MIKPNVINMFNLLDFMDYNFNKFNLFFFTKYIMENIEQSRLQYYSNPEYTYENLTYKEGPNVPAQNINIDSGLKNLNNNVFHKDLSDVETLPGKPIEKFQNMGLSEEELKNLGFTNLYPTEKQLWTYKWIETTPNYAGIRNIDKETILYTPPNTHSYGKAANVLAESTIDYRRIDEYATNMLWNPQATVHVVEPFTRGGFSTR